jgi:hypothetical protein
VSVLTTTLLLAGPDQVFEKPSNRLKFSANDIGGSPIFRDNLGYYSLVHLIDGGCKLAQGLLKERSASMARSRSLFLCRLAVVSLVTVAALPIAAARAQWHGGGGGWHGGGWGGGGWHGGWGGGGWGWRGWGWGPGVAFGFAVPPAYYAPPPAYYPPQGYYPSPAYPGTSYYPPPNSYGYTQGYYGGAVQQPYYANSAATDPHNCGTPDEPKACAH